MGFKYNPFTGKLDLTNPKIPQLGSKFSLHMYSIAAYDKIVSINYLDQGLKTQRINSIVMSSAIYPTTNVTKNIFWLDVGTKNQRIEKVEYIGAVFSPNKLRKVFNYALVNTRYLQNGFNFELI